MFGKSKAEYGSKHLIEHNEALMRDLSHQKAVLKQNQDELIRYLKEGVDLKAKLKESEAQMTTLTSGFVSLDQAHSVLQLQHRKRQEELLRINERLSRVNADLVVRAEGLQQEVARLQTSESIREESLSGNTIARMQDEAQNLRNDNERLHTEIKDTESRNGDLKSQVGDLTSQLNDVKSQLDECNKIIEEKDAELESVKTAQKARDSDAAGEKLRLEADLAKAREEKRLIEQVSKLCFVILKNWASAPGAVCLS
jgi:chromosome segregation ATPase